MSFWNSIFNDVKACEGFLSQCNNYDGLRWTHSPLIASLMLTYDCNLGCIYCPFQANNNQATRRSLKEWSALLEELTGSGIRRISFSGGEPLLYPDLNCLVKKATELGFKKGIVTNGIGLTEAKLEEYADIGLDALTVSVDTIDTMLYSQLCNTLPGMLENVLEMIITARRRESYWIGINTVITKMNVHALRPVIDFCSRHDVPVQFQIFNPFKGREDLMPAATELRSAIDLIKACKKRGAPVHNDYDYLEACCEFALTKKFPKQMDCLIPFAELVITPDLMVKACCASEEIGDASEAEWKRVWQGRDANHWRSKAQKKACRNCFLIYHEPLRLM
ncbi:MAG: radical SAM protein [Methanosarcinaceae archaeon]